MFFRCTKKGTSCINCFGPEKWGFRVNGVCFLFPNLSIATGDYFDIFGKHSPLLGVWNLLGPRLLTGVFLFINLSPTAFGGLNAKRETTRLGEGARAQGFWLVPGTLFFVNFKFCLRAVRGMSGRPTPVPKRHFY